MGTTARVLVLRNAGATLDLTPQVNYAAGAGLSGMNEQTAGADASTNINFGTNTTFRDVLLSPLTSQSALANTDANRKQHGWVVNPRGALGFDSVANGKRFIPAGTWQFGVRSFATVAQATSDTIVRAYVFRRTPAGAMFELVNTSSPPAAIGLGNTQIVWTVTVASIVLEADETLHFAYAYNSAGSLVANQVLNFHLNVYAEPAGLDPLALTGAYLPAPGVRTQYLRSNADMAPSSDTIARQILRPRATADTAKATDTVTRSTIGARSVADVARAADTTTRAFGFPRAVSDQARASDALTRFFTFPRATADAAPVNDTTTRTAALARIVADTARAADSVDRLINYVRGLRDQIGPGAGDFIDFPTRALAGIVRNNTGTPAAGATVLLMRQSDERAVRSATSAADGSYSFTRDKFDSQTYYVVSYLAGAPFTQGVTERGLVPVDG